ncbi:unnamed protein product [Lupinus luteus]|uniref:CCAAT-binding factor domain-containing protein n=1 Tax=Lupinus luteus TaxID=3873 RepID=A0AAV1XY89_LUPLU
MFIISLRNQRIQQPPQYACACLFLLSEVLKARPPLWNLVLQNEYIDDEVEYFEDVIKETDNEPSTTSNKQANETGLIQNDDSESEDDASDDASEDRDFVLARKETNGIISKSATLTQYIQNKQVVNEWIKKEMLNLRR